jgi:hypothetical protein
MRDAARALDDVSDHLGEVLRRADQLMAEWSGFGAQVRAQVEREVAGIGAAVDGAVARAAGAGLDRAIADRLRALTSELERLEQRTRAASRAVVEQRGADRRVLWLAVAGIVVANALLVVLLLRKPVAAPVIEPVRIESVTAPPLASEPAVAPATAAGDGSAAATGSAAEPAVSASAGSPVGSNGNAGGNAAAGSNATTSASPLPGAGSAGANAPARPGTSAPTKPAAAGSSARPPSEAAGAAKPAAAPVSLPPKGGSSRPHKKQP